jgi:uncharacterized membrane protein
MAGVFLAVTLLALAAPCLCQGWLYQFFAAACHQMPGRCYSFDGHPTALCVRCLWLYFGLGLGHAVFCGWRLSEGNARKLLSASAGLLLADVAFESLRLHPDLPFVRAVTGLLFGFACSWFTLRGLTELLHPQECNLPNCHEPNHT